MVDPSKPLKENNAGKSHNEQAVIRNAKQHSISNQKRIV